MNLALHILPAAQRTLWPQLSAVPKEFTLYGGTAIALQLGHRESVDFDFFARADFDPQQLLQTNELLECAEVTAMAKNTLSVRLNFGRNAAVSAALRARTNFEIAVLFRRWQFGNIGNFGAA